MELQAKLDLQWDYLEARDPRIKLVRKEIGTALDQLADSAREDRARASTERMLTEEKVDRVVEIEETCARLDEARRELDSGELSVEATENNQQLLDIDKQIAALTEKRSTLQVRNNELRSILSARQAKIDTERSAVRAGLHPDFTLEQGRALVDSLNARISDLTKEQNAARDGSALWASVIKDLNSLDKRTRGPPVQIVAALEETAQALQQHGELADQNHWGALVVAIGHELEIVREALDAVRNANLE